MSRRASLHLALRDFKQPAVWLGIWIFGWILCVVLSLMSPPDIDLDLANGDKLEHILAYGLLSVWSVLIFVEPRGRWSAALMLMCVGIAMELAQGAWTSDRAMDAMDALADAVGVLFGQMLAWSSAQTLLQRLDRQIFR
ncbi:MAG: VanZ family protein [Arenimonas sp.]